MPGIALDETNEGNVGPISFQYVESHRTYFAGVNLSAAGVPSYPAVGTVVAFDLPLIYYRRFSVAVELDQSKRTHFIG